MAMIARHMIDKMNFCDNGHTVLVAWCGNCGCTYEYCDGDNCDCYGEQEMISLGRRDNCYDHDCDCHEYT